MASQKKSTERPSAEDVARENYKREFGTTKPDAALPRVEVPATDQDPNKVVEQVGGQEPPKEN